MASIFLDALENIVVPSWTGSVDDSNSFHSHSNNRGISVTPLIIANRSNADPGLRDHPETAKFDATSRRWTALIVLFSVMYCLAYVFVTALRYRQRSNKRIRTRHCFDRDLQPRVNVSLCQDMANRIHLSTGILESTVSRCSERSDHHDVGSSTLLSSLRQPAMASHSDVGQFTARRLDINSPSDIPCVSLTEFMASQTLEIIDTDEMVDDSTDRSLPIYFLTMALATGSCVVVLLVAEVTVEHHLSTAWINELISFLWDTLFVLSNVCIFAIVPFAYFYDEAEGLGGTSSLHKTTEAISVMIIMAAIVKWIVDVAWALAHSFGLLPAATCLQQTTNCSTDLLFQMFTLDSNNFIVMYSLLTLFGSVLLLLALPVGFRNLMSAAFSLRSLDFRWSTKNDEDIWDIMFEIYSIEWRIKQHNKSGNPFEALSSSIPCSCTEAVKCVHSSVFCSYVDSWSPNNEDNNPSQFPCYLDSLFDKLSLLKQRYEDAERTRERRIFVPLFKNMMCFALVPSFGFLSLVAIFRSLGSFLSAIIPSVVSTAAMQLRVWIQESISGGHVLSLSLWAVNTTVPSTNDMMSVSVFFEMIFLVYIIISAISGLKSLSRTLGIAGEAVAVISTSHLILLSGMFLIECVSLPISLKLLGLVHVDFTLFSASAIFLKSEIVVGSYQVAFLAASAVALLSPIEASVFVWSLLATIIKRHMVNLTSYIAFRFRTVELSSLNPRSIQLTSPNICLTRTPAMSVVDDSVRSQLMPFSRAVSLSNDPPETSGRNIDNSMSKP